MITYYLWNECRCTTIGGQDSLLETVVKGRHHTIAAVLGPIVASTRTLYEAISVLHYLGENVVVWYPSYRYTTSLVLKALSWEKRGKPSIKTLLHWVKLLQYDHRVLDTGCPQLGRVAGDIVDSGDAIAFVFDVPKPLMYYVLLRAVQSSKPVYSVIEACSDPGKPPVRVYPITTVRSREARGEPEREVVDE